MSRNKWIVAALVTSVLINVALVGIFIGRALGGGFQPPPHNPAMALFGWARTLPDERKQQVLGHLRQYRQVARPNIREMRAAQGDFRREMLNEPMDRQAVLDSLERLQQALSKQQQTGHQALVDVLETLSPEERQALDEHFRKHRPKRPRKRPQRADD